MRFYKKSSDNNYCQLNYTTFFLLAAIGLFVIIAVSCSIYYLKLKCKNKTKDREYQKKKWRSKNDPYLTPTGSKKGSRSETKLFGSIGNRTRGATKDSGVTGDNYASVDTGTIETEDDL